MRRVSLIFSLCFAVLTVCGCAKDRVGTGKLGVVVSIVPLQEFAEKIGGDKVEVSVMVPPRATPHTYEPTPEQLVSVSKAKAYVKVGSPLEFELSWLDKILSTNRNMLVIDASKGVEFIKMEYEDEEHGHEEESGKEGYDPHIWLSPKNAGIMVENIYEGLISVDMDSKEYYTKNKESYMNELNSLDTYIEQSLSGKSNRKFMVYHPSWGYFARDYAVEQIPIEKEGKEPTVKGVKQVVEQARESGIKVIFASPQFNTASAEVIAREINGRMVLIDPLAKDYIANIRRVAQAFSEAMD
jgi:zinc transport system substrate-binding protein